MPGAAELPQSFEQVFSAERCDEPLGVVKGIIDDFQDAPGAHGLLRVTAVYKIRGDSEEWRDRKGEWDCAAKKLSLRASHARFPKPTWKEAPSKDGDTQAKLQERLDVLHVLKSRSNPSEHHPKISEVKIYHGCPTLDVACCIFKLGFAANVQNTKGWFGEGVYATTTAPYALRYSIGMQDIWKESSKGCSGYVVAGRAVYAHAFPVTQAENETPLKPGLKGTRIASAPGSQGADLQFVCVRGIPPFDGHTNRTYHAVDRGRRHEATELVTNQEAHFLPEFIVHVSIVDNSEQRQSVQQWVENARLHGNSTDDCLHMQELRVLVRERLGRDLTDNDVRYKETVENGLFTSTVELPFLHCAVQNFSGTPEPQKERAQQTAAEAAVRHLKLDVEPELQHMSPEPESLKNFKNELQALVQRELRRSVAQGDIVYRQQNISSEEGDRLRYSVKISSLLPESVPGSPRQAGKGKDMDAQQAAAAAALIRLRYQLSKASSDPHPNELPAPSIIAENEEQQTISLPESALGLLQHEAHDFQPPFASPSLNKQPQAKTPKAELDELCVIYPWLKTEFDVTPQNTGPFCCTCIVVDSRSGADGKFQVETEHTFNSKKEATQAAAKLALERLSEAIII